MPVPEMDLAGKVAIVTGSGRGIGRGVAICLAEGGADVVVVSRTESQLEETCKLAGAKGGRCKAIVADVTKAIQVERMVKETISKFGQIDILVNQVGAPGMGPLVPLPDYKGLWALGGTSAFSEESWNLCLTANLNSVFLCCREVGPHMLAQKKGKVINITSFVAAKGQPFLIPYTVNKAAVAMFTRSLALEWARYNINVNGIGPGYIPTDLNSVMLGDAKTKESLLRSVPLRRFGEPREIGLLALFLASPASDYITGQTVFIDGGLLA